MQNYEVSCVSYDKINTVIVVYDVSTVKSYYGKNGGIALNDGAKLSNLHIYTTGTTKKNFGVEISACENCTFAFKGKVKSNNSGWRN